MGLTTSPDKSGNLFSQITGAAGAPDNSGDLFAQISGAGMTGATPASNTPTTSKTTGGTSDATQNALIKGRSSTMLTGGRGLGSGDTSYTSKMLLGN